MSMNKTVSLCPCDIHQHSDQMKCHRCNLTWDTNDPDPPKCSYPLVQVKIDAGLVTADGAAVIFDELKTIVTGFLKRTEAIERQSSYIIAMVYTNAKKRAEDGDEWCAELVKVMDQDIATLNDLKGRVV